jgi:hypothetical protein
VMPRAMARIHISLEMRGAGRPFFLPEHDSSKFSLEDWEAVALQMQEQPRQVVGMCVV